MQLREVEEKEEEDLVEGQGSEGEEEVGCCCLCCVGACVWQGCV